MSDQQPFMKVTLQDFYAEMKRIGQDVSDIKVAISHLENKITASDLTIRDHEERLRVVESSKATIMSYLAVAASVLAPLAVFIASRGGML